MEKPTKKQLMNLLLDAVNEVEDLATASGRLAEYGDWLDKNRRIVGEREDED